MKSINKRLLSMFIVLAMILSTLSISYAKESEILVGQNVSEDNELKVAVECMKTHYVNKIKEYDYLEALTLKSLGVSNEIIQRKLKLEELSFEIGRSYKDSSSKEYAKSIMGLIAAGFNPTNYNEKDYVGFLAKSQTEKGHFETKKGSGDKADDLAYSILALDMAGAEYDVNAAVDSLKGKFTVKGEQAFVKEWSFLSDGNLELTAISLIALSNHKNIVGTDLIDKAINYIKSEKLSCGMYGVIDWGQEKESAKLTSKMIQALVAVGENIPGEMIDGLLNLRKDNKFKENKSSWNEYATMEAFAALADIYNGKSMFKEIKADVREPERVEVIFPEGQDSIKVGKKMQLSAKVYDGNGKYLASQKYIWSSSNLKVATVDEKGVVTGHKVGTATITIKVNGFEDVEKSIQINIVGVKPNSIDIKIDGDLSEIEVGRKVKIIADVLDVDKQRIEKADIQWEVSPKGLAEVNDRGILTALKPGNVTITASVEKDKEEVLLESLGLRIVTRQGRIGNALKEVKKGILASDKYEYTTAMGLKLMGADEAHIAEKALKYSYFPNTNTRAKDIMMAIALGKDPGDYHETNYVQDILESDFYNDENPEWLANAILALDMASSDYDESKAIKALLDKLEVSSGKYYIKGKYGNPSTELTALTLLALSKHKDMQDVDEAITGIKSYLKYVQDENALIENCKSHSLSIQALIASGESIYSTEWTKQDKYGNKITLLDALLSLKQGAEFKVRPDNKYTKSGQEVYAFAALVDLSVNKSMYHKIKDTGSKKYTVEIQTDSRDLALEQGEILELKAKVLENGNLVDKKIIWESLDNNIIKVKNGTLKSLKEGQTKVRAKILEDAYDEINVKVKQIIGKPEKVIIKGGKKTPIVKGDRFKLDATVLDVNGNKLENNKVIWFSSDSNIASIDKRGNVVANDVGSVEIGVQITDTDIKDIITVNICKNQETTNNTIDKFIRAVRDYYETDYYRESQGNLDAWETATFVRAGIDLDKWYVNKKYQPRYDMNLAYLGSKVNQALIMLDVGENPVNFDGRNLIKEIIEKINKADYGYANQNYLKAVIAVDKYNEKYINQKVIYDEGIVIKNILAAQTVEGGFKERGDSPVPLNTGLALKALSKHRGYDGVNESIEKALKYLQSIQKDDGAFYKGSYVTSLNAGVISGLLAVGEDLTSEKWSKGNANPIESLFILWKNNNSFDNQEGESKNNRGWIAATQKALYTLVDLKEAGYSNYVVKTAQILSNKSDKPEKTIDVYTAIIVDEGEKYKIYSKPKEVTINTKEHSAGLTALGSLQGTTSLYEMVGSMVTSIYGIENKGIGGWLYAVNDKMPDITPDKVTLKEGDKVVWFYSPKGMDGQIPTWVELTKEEPEEKFSIKIISDEKEIEMGKEILLKAKVTKGDKILTDKEIMWLSSNGKIATINEGGKLTAHKAGEVTIMAALKDNKDIKNTIKIKVVEEGNEKFKVEDLLKEVIVNGKQTRLKYRVTNLTNEEKKVKFMIGLYDKKTDKLVNYSSTSKNFRPEEEIYIGTIFLIPSKGDYYIKSHFR